MFVIGAAVVACVGVDKWAVAQSAWRAAGSGNTVSLAHQDRGVTDRRLSVYSLYTKYERRKSCPTKAGMSQRRRGDPAWEGGAALKGFE